MTALTVTPSPAATCGSPSLDAVVEANEGRLRTLGAALDQLLECQRVLASSRPSGAASASVKVA